MISAADVQQVPTMGSRKLKSESVIDLIIEAQALAAREDLSYEWASSRENGWWRIIMEACARVCTVIKICLSSGIVASSECTGGSVDKNRVIVISSARIWS